MIDWKAILVRLMGGEEAEQFFPLPGIPFNPYQPLPNFPGPSPEDLRREYEHFKQAERQQDAFRRAIEAQERDHWERRRREFENELVEDGRKAFQRQAQQAQQQVARMNEAEREELMKQLQNGGLQNLSPEKQKESFRWWRKKL